MSDAKKSRRGVYYNLDESPYAYKSPYGDLFKFSSQKKLDIYTRDIGHELKQVDKALNRNELNTFIQPEIVRLIYRNVYTAFHRKVER